MASSEIPPPLEPSSTALALLPPSAPALSEVPSAYMDSTPTLAVDDVKRCQICSLPRTPASFSIGPDEPFGWALFAGSSTTRCLACRSFIPCGACSKITDSTGKVPSDCLWCRKLSEVYRASTGEVATTGSLRLPEVAPSGRQDSVNQKAQQLTRKRRAEDDLSESSENPQFVEKEGPNLEAVATSESSLGRLRSDARKVKHADRLLSAQTLDVPVVGAAAAHMDVELEGSVQSVSDDGSQSSQASQAVVPVGAWSFGRVRQLFGIEPSKPEKPKKIPPTRTRKAVTTTSTSRPGNSRKRQKQSPVVKIEPESDVDLMESEASDAYAHYEGGGRSRLTHQGSQDTIRGTVGQDRALRFQPAPTPTASGMNAREKRLKREHDSTSPEAIPGAFHVPKTPQAILQHSDSEALVTLPRGQSILPADPSKATVVSKAMTLIAEYRVASLPPLEDPPMGETLAESFKASASETRKGKERAQEPPVQHGTDSLDWEIDGLDGGEVGNKLKSEDEDEKAQLIRGFEVKSRQLAGIIKTKQAKN